MRGTRLLLIGTVAIVALGIFVPAGAARVDRTADAKLTLVAYSTPREAYAKIIPLFQKSSAGQGVSFDQSYGSSGEQSRAVAAGLPADVVALSLEPDVTSLVAKGIVSKNWNAGFYKGMVTNSVVVFVVRDGNPKNIKSWNDLTRPGIEVITPNPATSGGAKWNVMAAYGGMLKQGKTHQQAIDYLGKLLEHTSVQDKSAREALQTFLGGKGDVLLAYENEAFFARLKKQPVQWVIPRATILIENPVAVTTTTKSPQEVRAFVNFLRTPEVQRIYGENGYRPVLKSIAKEFKYPDRPALFTIQLFGGWSKVDKKFFDSRTGIYTQLQRKAGKS